MDEIEQIVLFSDNLKRAINKKGISIIELSTKCGVSSRMIRHYMHAEHSPSVLTAKTLASALDVSLDELFNEKA